MGYAFEELHLEKLWFGIFDGNEKSRRVQEKCGFIYHHTNEKTGLGIIRIKKNLSLEAEDVVAQLLLHIKNGNARRKDR